MTAFANRRARRPLLCPPMRRSDSAVPPFGGFHEASARAKIGGDRPYSLGPNAYDARGESASVVIPRRLGEIVLLSPFRQARRRAVQRVELAKSHPDHASREPALGHGQSLRAIP
jgi:hypothetical protein